MKKNATVAVFIHTFLRDELMMRCVESVKKHLPNARIYLSDGGRMTDFKAALYLNLEDEGHWVKHYEEYNPWWRKIFNEKAELATEEYIVKVDDDFYFTEESNVDKFVEMIESDASLVLLGGRVFHEHRNQDSPYIYEVTGEREGKYVLGFAEKKPVGISYCDFTPDFWIAKRDLFRCVKMDATLKPAQGGHEKFFVDLYEARKDFAIPTFHSKVGFTNNITAFHEKGEQSDEYKRERASGIADYERVGRVIKP